LNEKRKKAGKDQITLRLHDLRHLFAVTYLRQGGNIYCLQKLLGHASIKTTELYLDYLTHDEVMLAQFGDGGHKAKRERGGRHSDPAQSATHKPRLGSAESPK
jgi:integrase/recombinase XerD